MQLTAQEKSNAWWGGALGGALSAVPKGLIIGLGAAAFMFFAVIPAAAAIGITLTPLLSLLTTASGAFNPLPLMLLNVSLLGITGAVCGGDSALKEYHQKKHNDIYEARITALEQTVPEITPQRSAAVQRILAQGPRQSHAHAEAIRSSEPSTRTL